MSTEREYVLGTHEAELARLGFQHQLWAGPTAGAWERGGFGLGQRILDVGSGPGYATLDLARLVGQDGEVVAIDQSERFLAHLRRQAEVQGVPNVTAHAADVAAMVVPEAYFDGAFARWVLCFVADPQTVIDAVAASLKPGGRFVVLDYSRYEAFTVAPQSAVVGRVIRAVAESFRMHGGDPDVGCRVPEMMHRAGLEVREVRPVVRIARAGTPLWEWPIAFFRIFLPSLVQMGGIGEADMDAFLQEWDERSADPASFLMTPPMVEVVGVKR